MKPKSILGAGVIAAAAVACTGPGMEAAGKVMRDAGDAMAGMGGSLADAGRKMTDGSAGARKDAGGQILADAGAMLADAGRMLSGAGGALAEAGRSSAGGGGTSGAQAQEQNDGLPRAHWVLRDKDGTPVKADFGVYDAQEDLFADASIDCISVQYFGNRYIASQYYRLTDGAFGVCYPGSKYISDTWRQSLVAVFGPADTTCTGPGLSLGNSFGAVPVQVGGTFYYADGAPDMSTTSYYSWNRTTQQCELQTSTSAVSLWAFKPIPDDVLNLLSNAPYTAELVY